MPILSQSLHTRRGDTRDTLRGNSEGREVSQDEERRARAIIRSRSSSGMVVIGDSMLDCELRGLVRELEKEEEEKNRAVRS